MSRKKRKAKATAGAAPPPSKNPEADLFMCQRSHWKDRASEELLKIGSPAVMRMEGRPPPEPPEKPFLLYPGEACRATFQGDIPAPTTDQYFLRFGWLPWQGKSFDFRTGALERGMAALPLSETSDGFRVELPQMADAVLALVLEVWQDKLLFLCDEATVVEEGLYTTWLSWADVVLLSPSDRLSFPEWLAEVPAAETFLEEFNGARSGWLPFRDRYARFRRSGMDLLLGAQEALMLGHRNNRQEREQKILSDLDRAGWRWVPGWGLRAPGAPLDPTPETGRGMVRTVHSNQLSPEYWSRELELREPEPPPDEWEECFVRFGPKPDNNAKSVCRGYLFEEPGASVFHAWRSPDGKHYKVDVQRSMVLFGYVSERLKDLTPHEVKGRLVGGGTGNEPCLLPITSYKRLDDDVVVEFLPDALAMLRQAATDGDLDSRFMQWQNVDDVECWAAFWWVQEYMCELRAPYPLLAARRLIASRQQRKIQQNATPQALRSKIHGPAHWQKVAEIGEELSKHSGADPEVVRLFAALHDALRLADHEVDNLAHGRRAAVVARDLWLGGFLTLRREQIETLCEALEFHADGLTSEDSTIGCCWDADRLELVRLGIKCNPAFMSTELGRITAYKQMVREATEHPPWEDEQLHLRYMLPPGKGVSYNHQTEKREGGVSVYRAQYDGDGAADTVGGYIVEIPGDDEELLEQFLEACYYSQKPCYLLRGPIVGTGSDREPVMGVVEEIVSIRPPERVLFRGEVISPSKR